MIRSLLIVALAGSLALEAHAQTVGRWWVSFHGREVPTPADLSHLTERALQRRAKVLPADRLTDENDRPVSPSFLADLRASGARIRTVSRWLNAASVEFDDAAAMTAVARLPFVSRVEPVRSMKRRPMPMSATPVASPLLKSSAQTTLSYGTSLTQNTNIKAVDLHEVGVIGAGVFVGMLDDGFNYHREHPALSPIRVVAEYDFIQRDSNTSVQSPESVTQGYHGSATLGTLAGYLPGSLVGPAYGATLALGKTEVGGSETAIEEDYYVEGLEWLEALGVDIISTSLGYVDWYPSYAFFDGQTATTTKAARQLARRGVLLVTAMGNEGHLRSDTSTTGTLIAPADADSILSVGATFSDGILAGFSSTGPTFDGRMKPEVVAQGTGVIAPPGTTNTGFSFWQGTSFSTPLTAAAAALILSAHPDATPMQIRSALMTTADRSSDGTFKTSGWPNPYYGFGRVNARAAALSIGPIVSNLPIVQYYVLNGTPTLQVSLRTLSNAPLAADQFALNYRRRSDTGFTQVLFAPTATPGLYSASFPVSGPADTAYVGYITYGVSGGPVLRRPVGVETFDLQPSSDSLTSLFPPGAQPPIPSGYHLASNYPNPFNAGTTFLFQAPRPETVRLDVYDLLGRHVRTVFDGISTAGDNVVPWSDVRDEAGRPLASGVYLYRLTTPQSALSGTMVLLK
jgi:subtilisin family serine protease